VRIAPNVTQYMFGARKGSVFLVQTASIDLDIADWEGLGRGDQAAAKGS
jgi:hypothetical protein